MSKFKVGDKVKLTGYGWESDIYNEDGAFKGNIVTIDEFDEDGTAYFNGWYVDENENDEYGAVFVESASESFVSDNVNPSEYQKGSLEAVVQYLHYMLEQGEDTDSLAWYLEGAMDALGIPTIENEEEE